MAVLIKLKENHLYPSTNLSDPKMIVTKEWKSLSKKTPEVKRKTHWFDFKAFETKTKSSQIVVPEIKEDKKAKKTKKGK